MDITKEAMEEIIQPGTANFFMDHRGLSKNREVSPDS
jgi:hypothetical protein